MENQITNVKRWLILFNVSLSIFMSTLDGSIVNIALPVISKQLSVSISSIQWVVTSYLLTISVLLLVWGRISDLFGKKHIFATGFMIFTIGSGLCAFSGSLAMLVLARILQAIGASSMMALSQGIVTSTFPAEERGRALGITGTTVAIGSLVGPSLGGILTHLAGWQSIFLINVPIGIIGTILTFSIIPEKLEKRDKKPFSGFDFNGSAMFAFAIILLFMGLLLLQEGVIPVAYAVPMVAVALAVLFGFGRYEKKIVNPLIDFGLFKNKVFYFGIICAYLSFVGTFSINLFVPFFLQGVLNLNTLSAGLLISFYPVTTAIVAPISGWLSDKITYRYLTVAGLIISAVTLIFVSRLNASSSFVEIAVLMSLQGVGAAVFQSPNSSSVMGSVPRNRLGIAGGINALFRNLGMVSGVAFSVIIFSFATKMNINNLSDATAFDPAVFLKGFRVVVYFAACAYFLAFLFSITRAIRSKGDAADADATQT